MIREFYPGEIKSKIRVYRDGKEVKPLIATCIAMSDKENEEVDGYIDLVDLIKDENGNIQLDEYGNIFWICADTNLEDDWYEANRQARAYGLEPLPRPAPAITRWYGKIRWELVK
jgi:hypothetical protein